MPKPRVFIGSSQAAILRARAVESNLTDDAEPLLWKHAFDAGSGTLQALVDEAALADFAVLVLTPDDFTVRGGATSGTPTPTARDNVVFELGLFMGKLGPSRTFGVMCSDDKAKVPSDLAGITLAMYGRRSDGNLRAELSPACNAVIAAIHKHGPMPRPTLINPAYDADLAKLDGMFRLSTVIGPETVVIVVGGGVVCELLDRPTAAWLRDEIDRRGGGKPFRRAVVVGYDYWITPSAQASLPKQPTISIGSEIANPLTGQVAVTMKAEDGTDPLAFGGGLIATATRTAMAGVRIAMWGNAKASVTRSVVEEWVTSTVASLDAFLEEAGWT